MKKLFCYEFNSCLDIGANLGQFAHEVLNNKEQIRIVSIEPNPHCARKLKNAVNEYYICALGNKKEKLKLLVPTDKRTSKASSFFLHANKTGNDDVVEIEVDVHLADELFSEDQFDLIKIDTQGYEYFVIDGAKELIKRSKYVLIEFQTKLTNKGAPESIESVKLLNDLGFGIVDLIDINNSEHLAKFNSVHLDILFEKRDNNNLDCLVEYKDFFKDL